jgi:predicted esterase
VPNIDRERSLLGGFSNGAHTTAALLSHPETAAAVAARFGRFALIDGGTRLRPAVSLQSKHLLLLQGALHHRDLFAEARLSLAASGAELYSRTMPDVGHKFSLQGHAILREWLAAHASPASEGLSRLP